MSVKRSSTKRSQFEPQPGVNYPFSVTVEFPFAVTKTTTWEAVNATKDRIEVAADDVVTSISTLEWVDLYTTATGKLVVSAIDMVLEDAGVDITDDETVGELEPYVARVKISGAARLYGVGSVRQAKGLLQVLFEFPVTVEFR